MKFSSICRQVLGRIVGPMLITASVIVTGSGQRGSEAKAAAPCGVRVYMSASGSTAQDATNDQAVKTSLELGTDLCITIGVEYYQLSTVAVSVTKSNYDVIYLQGQNNWRSETSLFDNSDYTVVDNFVSAGGGLVVGEWIAWDACAEGFAGAWGSLDTIMPTTIRTSCNYGSNQNVRFYRWNRPTTAALDTGVDEDFIFVPADFDGSLSFLTLKTGATGYYWARWNPVVANIPAAVDPSTSASDLGVGMAGWVPAGKSGRVFSFATTNGAPELASTSSSNSFRTLLINSLGWAGSVGGSVTPDAVSVSGTAGSSLSTPALKPTNISGTVTYSISGGALPSGLVLDTSTGAITGTPVSGGSVNITIQASGSGGGSGTSVVALQIAGPATSTTVASTTPTTPTSATPPATTAPTSATAPATVSAPVRVIKTSRTAIAEFAGFSSALTSQLRAQVREILANNPKASAAKCRGFVKVSELVNREDAALARARAAKVCDYIKTLRPSMHTSITRASATEARRRVEVTIRD